MKLSQVDHAEKRKYMNVYNVNRELTVYLYEQIKLKIKKWKS